jgi:hypothetical protein
LQHPVLVEFRGTQVRRVAGGAISWTATCNTNQEKNEDTWCQVVAAMRVITRINSGHIIYHLLRLNLADHGQRLTFADWRRSNHVVDDTGEWRSDLLDLVTE